MPSRQPRQPPGPSGAQMLANIALMRRSPPAFLDKCVARFGPVVRFPIPHSDVWLLADSGHVDQVLRTDHKAFAKSTMQYETLKTVTGDGLLTSDGDVWREMRRIVAPSFHHKLLVDVAQESHAAATKWAEATIVRNIEDEIDIDAAMLEVSLEIVSRTLLGGQVLESSRPLVDAVMDALRIVVSRAQQPPIPLVASLSSGDRRLAEALSVINSSVAELVARRESAGASEDTLSLLIDARDQGVITEQQVRDEVVTLIVAGHETVAATLTWTWLLLAANPHVERLVHSEASALNADDASSPLVLERLPITCAVVQECLRLYPPAWVITRRALREQSVGGFDMPSGTTVIMSPYLLHRDDRRWPEPERFDPMRFQSGTVQSPAAARSFLPFGTGPRLCIGRDLALVEAPLVIAAISRLLRLRALRPAAVVEDFGVTLRPRGGLLMQVLGREQISAE